MQLLKRQFFSLILRNTLRHKLRTGLTVLGLVIAVLSFGLLQTVVGAWYAGANAAAPDRLVTRNAISLVFPMPLHYREKIRAVPGVKRVGTANWFGGIYQDPKKFFPQFAVDATQYFDMYPEYRFSEEEKRAFLRDRRGTVVGRKLAETYGFKVGDTCRCAARSSPATGASRCAPSTTARRRAPTPRRCSSTGTTSTRP